MIALSKLCPFKGKSKSQSHSRLLPFHQPDPGGPRRCIINLPLCPALTGASNPICILFNYHPLQQAPVLFALERILHCTHSYYLRCSPEKSIPVQTPSPAIQINKPSEGLSHSSISPVCSLKTLKSRKIATSNQRVSITSRKWYLVTVNWSLILVSKVKLFFSL